MMFGRSRMPVLSIDAEPRRRTSSSRAIGAGASRSKSGPARDEFVRKGSFDQVVTRLEKSMEILGAKVETAVDKMSSKIDHLSQAR